MPRRTPGLVSRTLSQFWDAIEDVEDQRESHAKFWDDWNAEALAAEGPLWVALGDSSSQGLGAVDPNDGWVVRMADRLREKTGEPWRVINLSITGGQLGDVIEHQLPRYESLLPVTDVELVTHLAGANDLNAPITWPFTMDRIDEIIARLPADAVVGRVGVSSLLNSVMGRRINAKLDAASIEKPFHLFWPWAWPSRDGLAPDRFHPNPIGYGYMLDLIWEPIAASLSSRGRKLT